MPAKRGDAKWLPWSVLKISGLAAATASSSASMKN
jgi:hypothetical protein